VKRHVPNILTLLNVLSGSIAVLLAVGNQWEVMAVFVGLGMVFDFLDGFVARALNAQGPLGKQLDSLADMITFGLVPGIVMYQLLRMSLGTAAPAVGENMNWGNLLNILPYVGFVITLSSAYRLAHFNIDDKQSSSFIGLPTPANALLIVSLPLILLFNGNDAMNDLILNPWFLVVLTILSSVLLNAPIPLFSLKFKTWNFKDNALRYIFILVSLVFIGTMKFLAIPAIIITYLLSSFLLPREKSHA
jgi:CDP-diacylglycerol--serine O-phosphatidyltransferase